MLAMKVVLRAGITPACAGIRNWQIYEFEIG